ncbi:MAG: IS3 family transposase [Calditrichaeota bacterium]|nr:IS3 family transposase [Calditrichota bacterium]
MRRLLRKMGLMAIYPGRNLSKLELARYIHSNKLRGLEITHSTHVWCIDLTYIPMQSGFLYLTVIIDVYSRYIVGWGISNSLKGAHSLRVLQHAIADHGSPEIINSDQGAQFMCDAWVSYLKDQNIVISMDSKGRCLHNTLIERFWRTLKREYVYLNPTENGSELYQGIRTYFHCYNKERTHKGINRQRPFDWYEYAA